MKSAPEIPSGFRPINGFPFYCVSEYGVVLSCRTRGGRIVQWRPMTQQISKDDSKGRWFVCLRDGSKFAHPIPIHVIVLGAFCGQCPIGLEGCHNDGNKDNNHISNLRWDTHKSNMEDREKHGRTPKGERNGQAILTAEQVMQIRHLNASGIMQKTVAPRFGVARQTIQAACSNTTWRHL